MPRRFVALALATGLLAGCTLGPSTRTDLAVYGAPRAAAATSTAPDARPTGPGGSGSTTQFNDAWSQCPTDLDQTVPAGRAFTFDCNKLTVPANYAERSGSRFTLFTARARSQAAPADAPTLVVGLGTGQLGIGLDGASTLAATVATLPATVTDHFVIVGVDLRGSGRSGQIDCLLEFDQMTLAYGSESLFALDPQPDTAAQVLSVGRDLTYLCGDLTAPLTTYYNTTAMADDLDALRSALGLDELNLLGTGFAANLGAVYLDRYPGRVDHAVLDAPVDQLPSAADRAAARAPAYEALLDAYADDCLSGDVPCPLGEDPRAALTKLMADLVAPDGGAYGAATAGTVRWLLTLDLPRRERWPELTASLTAAMNGNPSPVQDELTELVSQHVSGWLLVTCNDSAERITEADLAARMTTAQAASPMFGAFLVGLTGICGSWPVPESPLAAVSGTGAPPVLVLGGTKDAVAPYASTQSLATQLASARLLSWQGTDHGSYPRTSCVTEAVDAYLIDNTLPGTGLLCPA